MKHFLSTAATVIVLAATCVACDKIKPPQPELQKPPVASGEASPQDGERQAFAHAAQKELDELRAAIAEFRAKAEAANVQTKARLSEEVGKLEAELRETEQHLVELKSATVESWNQVKASFGNSLDKLKSRIENFRKSAA